MAKMQVKQHNNLITARYDLSESEKRLLVIAIGKKEELQRTQTVTVSEYCSTFNVDRSTAIRDLRNAVDKLIKRTIKFPDNDEEWNWLSRKAVYVKGEGRVEFSFTTEVLSLLLNLKGQYTYYDLINVGRFSSKYTIRFYEYLMQWRSTGKMEIEVDEIRERYELGNKYPTYGKLNERVISPSIKEINAHSDYQVQYRPSLKVGKKVIKLEFIFIPNKQQSLELT